MYYKIFLKYRHRADFTVCPRCRGPIRWAYVDLNWIPCDITPCLIYPYEGDAQAVYKGALINCTIYDGLRKEFPVYAHIPHTFTCRGRHSHDNHSTDFSL